MRIARENFTEFTKRAARDRAAGKCEDCGWPFGPKNPPEVDHRVECWEGGDNSLENAIALGRTCCHTKKTAAAAARRAKADRQRARYLDTKVRKGRPLPGTRASGLRKRMNGQVERW